MKKISSSVFVPAPRKELDLKAFSGSTLVEENDFMQVGRNPVFFVATAFSLRNCHRNVTTFYFPVKNGCFGDFLDYIYSLRVVTLSSVTREKRVRKRVNPALTSDSVLGLEAENVLTVLVQRRRYRSLLVCRVDGV